MSSTLNPADDYDLVDDIQRDEKSSIAEIVRQLNSKVQVPETPDSIATVRESSSFQKEIQFFRHNSSILIRGAGPQFIEDLNIVLKTFENNTYVEMILIGVVSEQFPIHKKLFENIL